MRASKPSMRILVARILPMAPTRPANCADFLARVVALNKAITARTDEENNNTTAGETPLTVGVSWTCFDDATGTIDRVHPNSTGHAKLVASW
ncbi:hypothetical protein SBRCBS47491_005020 [Sporothrix bragantina]|uniref:SGNH hydrolase-type esterase domain-containing protein n=1 Tax=Sporothrix bragantina TaxID=671064 RepID=A0ABP0BT38_9PEZI